MKTAPANMLRVRHLRVVYRTPRHGSVPALEDVSFDLREGEWLGIAGQSGSGKSTLARVLLRLLPPDRGTVHFRGEDVLRLSRPRTRAFHRNVQMVFQDAAGSLNPRMNVGRALKEALRFHGAGAAEAERRTAELLAAVGLDPAIRDALPGELSGGQCQRVSLARALAPAPALLVADEPVSALDVSVQARILKLLADLRRRFHLSGILVAHDLAVLRQVCDTLLVLKQGRIVESGPANRVLEAPKSAYTRALIRAVPDVRGALAQRLCNHG